MPVVAERDRRLDRKIPYSEGCPQGGVSALYLFSVCEGAPVLCRGGARSGLPRSALPFPLPAILPHPGTGKRENRWERAIAFTSSYVAELASATPAQDRGSQCTGNQRLAAKIDRLTINNLRIKLRNFG